MTTKCVEPGEAATSTEQYVVMAPQDDELLFPHVDSCIAIAFVMNSGRYIGGHVGMQMPNDQTLQPHRNAMNICAQMMQLAQNGTINRVILVGDRSVWRSCFVTGRDVVQDIINQTNCTNSLFASTEGFGGGVNFSLNPNRRMAFISRCTGGGGTFILQQPFTNISGHMTKTL